MYIPVLTAEHLKQLFNFKIFSFLITCLFFRRNCTHQGNAQRDTLEKHKATDVTKPNFSYLCVSLELRPLTSQLMTDNFFFLNTKLTEVSPQLAKTKS